MMEVSGAAPGSVPFTPAALMVGVEDEAVEEEGGYGGVVDPGVEEEGRIE